MRSCIVALLLLAVPARGADDLVVLAGKAAPREMLRGYLLAEAKKHFDARRALVAALKTPSQIRKRQEELRAAFRAALGDFPERTPLKARVVGKLRRDGYTVEKVIYESRPEHHVTASFYLPDGTGPFPGVLMPIGHSITGKAAEYVQRGAILLAKHGFTVLAYDPIGQGERRQLLEAGKAVLSSSTSEHTMVGVGALLVGRNTASYRVWDGLRSLDYLASRPEVDARRLGCTGCSGGGTLTSYLMALDDRILAAAPSCYITSLERLFETIGPQDAEQNITGQVAFGMEHADYLGMRAPRPTLICAASRDFFDIQGTWASFREAKRLYGRVGHGERVDLFESDGGHGFPKEQREAMLRWMRRWLMGKDDAPVEEACPLLKEADLRCTRTGQVLDDLRGVSVFQLNARRAAQLAKQRPALQQKLGQTGLRQEVARLLGVRLPVPAAAAREVGVVTRGQYRIRKMVYQTEPGVVVPALLAAAPGAGGALVVRVDGEGKSTEALDRLVKTGRRVLALDLRGQGETAPAPAPKKPPLFGVDYREAFMALHLNRPLLGQRVVDLMAVVAHLAAIEKNGIELIGAGKAGAVALHAAALDARIASLTLERSLVSWSAVVRTPISHDQLSNAVPGALAVYDLPELASLVVPRVLRVEAAVDGVGKPVAAAELEAVWSPARRAYEREKAGKNLVLKPGP
jgi:cephalosporin-C deacetylase-like acetyl esterase